MRVVPVFACWAVFDFLSDAQKEAEKLGGLSPTVNVREVSIVS